MHFGLSEQARELQAGVRDVLSTACTTATVRSAWGEDRSAVDELWKTLGALGLMGVLLPTAAGGLGLDDVVAVAVLEQAGWAGVPGPLVETVVVAAPLLASAGALPPGLLEGAARVAVQHGPVVAYGQRSQGIVQLLDGSARWLEHEDARPEPVATVDGSRQSARIFGQGALLAVGPAEVVRATLRGSLGTAAFLLGLARRQVDLTVAYVQQRQQFGVPVGSFQAVKHPLADAVVGTEFAWPAVLRAAHSLQTGDPDAAVHVSMAKALASDAAYRVSRTCLQAHGAMAYTVEYDLQLFTKRTWAMVADWGSAAEHRERIATYLRLEERTTA